MLNQTPRKLLEQLKGKTVVVWGARMTGMGFSRFLASNGHSGVTAFVDSDPALQDKQVNGISVVSPQSLPVLREQYPSLMIVIAVALKEQEIIQMLGDMNFGSDEYKAYSNYCTDFYTIDVVGTCNLKCPSCAHGSEGMESPRGLMPFDNFKKVVDKAISETGIVSHISLFSWGEPLLHPKLGRMVDYLHQNGVAAAVSSNLSIKEDKLLRKLIQSSPEYLKVSLSGYYPDAYNQTHTGGDINLVKSNLYRLRYLIDKYQVTTLVDVNYHLYTNNCGKNLRKMKALCDELGFLFSTIYSLVMPIERLISHCKGVENSQLDRLRSLLLVDIDEGIGASSKVEINGCPFRDNQININWDLTVPVCCIVFNRNPDIMVANNYLKTSMTKIDAAKREVKLCGQCMAFGLPAYNMGFNRDRWAEIAGTKEIVDS